MQWGYGRLALNPNVELRSTCTAFLILLRLLGNVTVTLNPISVTVHTLEKDLSQFINGDLMQRSLASINLKQSSTQKELICCWLDGPLAIWATSGTLPPSLPSHSLFTNVGSYKELQHFIYFPEVVFFCCCQPDSDIVFVWLHVARQVVWLAAELRGWRRQDSPLVTSDLGCSLVMSCCLVPYRVFWVE